MFGNDDITFSRNWYEKGAHESEFFCSKRVKTEKLWCQAEVTSSCPTLVVVSQNPKARKN
jgi:hypothetical protein